MPSWEIEFNADKTSFKSGSSTGEIVLDFATETFSIINGKEQMRVNLKRNFLDRGNFFYITAADALWVAKPRLTVPADWNKDNKSGLQAETPLVIFFKNGIEKYRKSQKDLAFSKVIHNPAYTLNVQSGPKHFDASDTWLETFHPDIRAAFQNPPRASNNAFIPRLYLQEVEGGRTVVLDVMSGRISEAQLSDMVKPATTTNSSSPTKKLSLLSLKVEGSVQGKVLSLSVRIKNISEKPIYVFNRPKNFGVPNLLPGEPPLFAEIFVQNDSVLTLGMTVPHIPMGLFVEVQEIPWAVYLEPGAERLDIAKLSIPIAEYSPYHSKEQTTDIKNIKAMTVQVAVDALAVPARFSTPIKDGCQHVTGFAKNSLVRSIVVLDGVQVPGSVGGAQPKNVVKE